MQHLTLGPIPVSRDVTIFRYVTFTRHLGLYFVVEKRISVQIHALASPVPP